MHRLNANIISFYKEELSEHFGHSMRYKNEQPMANKG